MNSERLDRDMRGRAIVAVLVAVFLAGCADTDRYPITGVECGPEDPVKTMPDCKPPV